MAQLDLITPTNPEVLLDDYIAHLKQMRERHGNLPVQKWTVAKGRHAAPLPELAYEGMLPTLTKQGGGVELREGRHFWRESYDKPQHRGRPVVRV